MNKFFLIVFLFIIYNTLKSQVTTAWTNPGTGSTSTIKICDPDANKANVNTGNILLSDNSYAYTNLNAKSPTYKTSYLLLARSFGFSIPSTATVTGIEVMVEGYYSSGGEANFSDCIYLLKSSSPVGTLNASTLTTTDTKYYYGNSSNLWGTTWTYTEINDAGFGVGISGMIDDVTLGAGIVYFDNIQVRITYTDPAPIELLSFTGKNEKEINILEWTTASETNNDYFIVERNTGQVSSGWEAIGTVKGAGNSITLNNYSFIDNNVLSAILYYRLKQTDYDGKFTYPNIISIISQQTNKSTINIYPSIASNAITLETNINNEIGIVIYDVFGRKVYNSEITGHESQISINISNLSGGIYFLKLTNGAEQNQMKFVKQ